MAIDDILVAAIGPAIEPAEGPITPIADAAPTALVPDEVNVAKRKPGNPFKQGHPKYGGRPKGSANKRTKAAQEMALAMNVDPVQFMLKLLVSDSVPAVVMDPATGRAALGPDGKPQKYFAVVPLEMKVDVAKALAKYIHPTLAATQITGKDDGPVQTAHLDIYKLLSSPEAVDAAQNLALLMAKEPEPAELPEPEGDGDRDPE